MRPRSRSSPLATLNPLLDPAPPAGGQTTTTQQAMPAAPTPPPNLLLGVLRRWPWLLLGIAAGLVLGLIYHMQRAPVYQSTSELMVLKNRPEMIAPGVGDTRVQVLEDYVAGQVLLLQSE